MTTPGPDTDALLDRAAAGDAGARNLLLARHRRRLRRLIAVRLDRRLAARVDPSDVVQESLAEADRRLDAYLAARPLPFYPWLRRLALERLVDLHRRHVRSQKRSVRRELPLDAPPPDESLRDLAGRLLDHGSRLRGQTLGWLRADLDAYRRLPEKEPDKAGPLVRQQMQHWQQDKDFAGVRGPKALARLPEAERLAWQQLWADVADTLSRAEGKSAPAGNPDPK
jgi:RNA polymerase sigma-70 factor, ECF subfamily